MYDPEYMDSQDDPLLVQALEDYEDDRALVAASDDDTLHQIQLGGNPLAQEGGRLTFRPEPIYDRVSQRFGVQERVVRLRPVQQGRLIPPNQLVRTLTGSMQQAINRVLNQMNVPDDDRFYVSLASDRLRSASNAFHVTAGEWRHNDLRANALLTNLSNMLNSNENFRMDDSFNLSVVHVRPTPRGSGTKRKYVPGHQSNVRLKQLKRTVIGMPRDEQGWCAVRAIVTARGFHLAGRDYKQRQKWRRSQRHRQQAAAALALEAGLTPGAWGPEELTKIALLPSMQDYKLVVIDASRAYSATAYGQGDTRLGLLYDQGHYDTLTSVEGFLTRAYFCNQCLKAYNTEAQHKCTPNRGTYCTSCRQEDCEDYKTACQTYRSPDTFCHQCQRHFYGPTCWQRHLSRTIQRKVSDQNHRPSVRPSVNVPNAKPT